MLKLERGPTWRSNQVESKSKIPVFLATRISYRPFTSPIVFLSKRRKGRNTSQILLLCLLTPLPLNSLSPSQLEWKEQKVSRHSSYTQALLLLN